MGPEVKHSCRRRAWGPLNKGCERRTWALQDIQALGHKVWFDQETAGGQAWWDQVLAQVRECNLFVFALAPETLDSYACKLEYTYAFSLHKTILPILVSDGVSLNLLPPALSAIQFVDYRRQDRQSVLALGRAITSLPVPQPLPDPLPKSPEVPISYLGGLKEQIETTDSLAFQEQTALLLRLKERLGEVNEFNDVIDLLRRLRKRHDLFAIVAAEIDTLLTIRKKASAEQELPHKPKTSPKTHLASTTPEPSQVVSHDTHAAIKDFNVDNATQEISEILQRIIEYKEIWVLRWPPDNPSYGPDQVSSWNAGGLEGFYARLIDMPCKIVGPTIAISFSKGAIIAKAAWSQNRPEEKIKFETLTTLGWVLSLSVGDWAKAFATGATLGLVLYNESFRKAFRVVKTSRTWAITDAEALPRAARDITQALRVIASDSTTITAERQ